MTAPATLAPPPRPAKLNYSVDVVLCGEYNKAEIAKIIAKGIVRYLEEKKVN